MMSKTVTATCLVVSLAILVGCSSKKPESTSGLDAATVKAIGEKYLVDQEPGEPKDVNDVVENVADKETVTVLGRIGGDPRPFVQDVAAFMIVDRKLKSCSDIEGDDCPTPWDYCCEKDLGKNSMTVKFIDDKGQNIPIDAKELFQLKELQTVVVSGELRKTADGSVALLANKMYVRKQ
jgi:hypothetical protein